MRLARGQGERFVGPDDDATHLHQRLDGSVMRLARVRVVPVAHADRPARLDRVQDAFLGCVHRRCSG